LLACSAHAGDPAVAKIPGIPNFNVIAGARVGMHAAELRIAMFLLPLVL
jgi:hypothetical protein